MGYVMHQLGGTLHIPLDDESAALHALRELAAGVGYLAFVPLEELRTAEDLRDALAACRWSIADEDEAGSIAALEFTGEKWGDDEALFSALAPYVNPGGEIRMVGEDGEVWRWLFDGRIVRREYGRVQFSPEWGPEGVFHKHLDATRSPSSPH